MMKRRPLFVIIEIAVLIAAEGVNLVTLAPIPLHGRLMTGLAVAAFVALGFFIPGKPRARIALLAIDAALLMALSSFSGLAVMVSVLLPLRALELQARNRAAFIASLVFSLAAFAVAMFVGITVEHRPAQILSGPVLIPLYTLTLALVVMANDLRRSRAELSAINAELALRADRWEEIATLTERYRIGRDLQDEIGQGLGEIGDGLEKALGEAPGNPDGARVLIFHAQRTAAFTLAALQRTVSSLRAESLAHGNITETLRDLCRAFATAGRLPIAAVIDDTRIDDPLVIGAVERIAREALINVARHSDATAVKFAFGPKGTVVELTIEDNGVGFQTRNVRTGNGFAMMHDQAAEIGGVCEIDSSDSHGTTVRLTFPLSS
jgi:signal transduction histidine kinase